MRKPRLQQIPVSLATVYNTLHQFTEVGLLREVAVDGSKTYFDTNVTDHHHFYVEDDNEVIDIPEGGMGVGNIPEPPPGYEDNSRGCRRPASPGPLIQQRILTRRRTSRSSVPG